MCQTPFDMRIDTTEASEEQVEDPIEGQVRDFFEALEQAPQEVQVAVCSRLM